MLDDCKSVSGAQAEQLERPTDGAAEAGSYAFGTFRANEQELARLKRQARIALDIERQVWARAGLRPGMQVLDLACGPGILSFELARLVEDGQVLGVDLSPDLIHDARGLQRQEGLKNVDFRVGSVYALEELDAQFDFVYARLLFQHLERPVEALASVRRVLKPGGRVCVLDVDDAWLMLSPEPAGFATFTREAALGQARRGGDRHVGRRLAEYMRQVGYSKVETLIQPVTSHDIGLKNFLDITTGFKLEQILPERRAQAEEELKSIYELLEVPGAWGAVAVFVGVGEL